MEEEEKGWITFSVTIPRDEKTLKLIRTWRGLVKMEGEKLYESFLRMVEEYVERHSPGNPQLPITKFTDDPGEEGVDEIVERLREALSNYFFGHPKVETFDRVVGPSMRDGSEIIWISPELFKDLCEGLTKEGIVRIITEVTGRRFPDEWEFDKDFLGEYWYCVFDRKSAHDMCTFSTGLICEHYAIREGLGKNCWRACPQVSNRVL